MTPRTILYTGKGGVGKTSVAAASAARIAASGRSTLILSTDPAHSLSASLQQPLAGSEPTPVADRLWALEVDAHTEMARHWAGVQGWLGELLVDRGIERITADELTVPPGMDELFSLLQLEHHHRSGAFDTIVVDCAPTGETLRMLSFPEVARWWLDRAFPSDQRLIAMAAPLARSVLDIPLPSAAVFADLQRLSENLLAMNEILRDDANTSVRLVLNPDRMVIGEAMRTFTYLNLYGYLTDAVIVNKVFPQHVGGYFDHWRAVQEENLALVSSAFAPVPVLTAPYFDREVIGPAMLGELADAVFGAPEGAGAGAAHPDPRDPAAILHTTVTQRLRGTEDGAVLRLSVPLTRKEEISLKQIGSELIVTAAGQRRTITLPPSLAAMRPTGAKFDDDVLEVSFSRA